MQECGVEPIHGESGSAKASDCRVQVFVVRFGLLEFGAPDRLRRRPQHLIEHPADRVHIYLHHPRNIAGGPDTDAGPHPWRMDANCRRWVVRSTSPAALGRQHHQGGPTWQWSKVLVGTVRAAAGRCGSGMPMARNNRSAAQQPSIQSVPCTAKPVATSH